MDEFDVIVIGAGPSGEVCAEELSSAGLSVAIVEAGLVGGTCAYFACMPSKALLRPEQLRREVERVPGLPAGAAAGIDTGSALSRRDQVISGLDDEAKVDWLEEREIALYRGCASFTGEKRLQVGQPGRSGDISGSGGEGSMAPARRELAARRAVVIATGSGALMPTTIEGLDRVDAWNNREGTTAGEVPESLIVLGGGPVGSELAQAWSSLGSEVILVDSADRLLAGEEPFASEQLRAALENEGIEVITGAEVIAVNRDNGDDVVARLDSGRQISAAEILVAVGRRPRVEELDLKRLGLPGSGYIEVNGRMRVIGVDQGPDTGAWLYAIGDVNGRALLTHMGKYQARIAAADILHGRQDSGEDFVDRADPFGPPRVTFTDPQVAAVGLTEAEARQRGLDIEIVETDTSGTAGASFHGRNTEGTSRLIADTENGVLVGATFVGYETAEMLHAATIAIIGKVPITRLRHAVPAFPTRSEIWARLLDRFP